MSDLQARCGSCGKQVSTRFRCCNYCGWSNDQKCRLCLKCEGPVALSNGTGKTGAAGGGGGLLGALMAWFFGLALSLAILFGVGLAVTLAGSLMLGYKCSMCGWTAPEHLLTKEERSEKGSRRLKLIMGSVAMGVCCVASFAWWVWAVKSLKGA